MKFKVSQATSLKALAFCVAANSVGIVFLFLDHFDCWLASSTIQPQQSSRSIMLAIGYIMYEEIVNGKDMMKEGKESIQNSSLVFGQVYLFFCYENVLCSSLYDRRVVLLSISTEYCGKGR